MRTLASQLVNRQNMGRALDLASHQQQTDALQQRDRVHAQANTTADPTERARLLTLALSHHERAASTDTISFSGQRSAVSLPPWTAPVSRQIVLLNQTASSWGTWP